MKPSPSGVTSSNAVAAGHGHAARACVMQSGANRSMASTFEWGCRKLVRVILLLQHVCAIA
jgi:hypothetical protein